MPNYTYLKDLTLHHNSITNIEAFCFINAPNLKKLFIDFNHIVNIKPIKKFAFKLKEFSMYKNHIKDWKYLSNLESIENGLDFGSFGKLYSFYSLIKVKELRK